MSPLKIVLLAIAGIKNEAFKPGDVRKLTQVGLGNGGRGNVKRGRWRSGGGWRSLGASGGRFSGSGRGSSGRSGLAGLLGGLIFVAVSAEAVS